jgi:hypothetical protein
MRKPNLRPEVDPWVAVQIETDLYANAGQGMRAALRLLELDEREREKKWQRFDPQWKLDSPVWNARRIGLRRFEVGSHVVLSVFDTESVLTVPARDEQLLPTISDRNDSCSKRKGEAGMVSPRSFSSTAS